MTFTKILIAVDSGEYAMAAAQTGLQLAHQMNAQTALVFVVDKSKAMGSVDAGITPHEALIILKKEAEQTLDQLARMYGDKEILKFMPEGNPAEDIIRMAETWGADLLVVGTHARTGLARLLLGSTAEQVVRHSTIPVMVVPSKK
ncbi:MAG: universal stress protein [Vicinamibacteria bacterium]|nr:universal stress protein [Vicinamibacteria bacterium]